VAVLLFRMDCTICSTPIEAGAKTIQMACCDRVYHTGCGLQSFLSMAHWSSAVHCHCGAVVYQSYDHTTSSHTDDIPGTAILNSDELKPQLKQLKKKLTEIKSTEKEFIRYVKQEYKEFEETVLQQLDAIKVLKNARMAHVKQSAEYKKFSGAKRSFNSMISKIKTKYPAVSLRLLKEKLGNPSSMWRSRYMSPCRILKRRFRLRKWYQ